MSRPSVVHGPPVLLPALLVVGDGLPNKIIPRILRPVRDPYPGISEPGKLAIGKRWAAECMAAGDDHNLCRRRMAAAWHS